MKKFKLSSFLPLSYILLLVLVSPLYDVLNKSTVHAVDVTTVVDDWIPFVKAFIIPYLFGFLTYTAHLFITALQIENNIMSL